MRWLDGGDGDSLAGRHGSPPLVDGTVVSLLGGGLRPLLLSGPAGLLLQYGLLTIVLGPLQG